MKNFRSYPDQSSSISQGSREAFAADDDEGGKSTLAAGARKHKKKKDRSPSPDSGCDGLDVAEVAATGTWMGEKKTKIQSAPTSENLCMIERDDEPSNKVVHVNNEQDWLKQLVGCDWNFNDLKLATDQYVKQLHRSPPDSYDRERPDEQQLEELMSRLALYRLRAYKGDELNGLDEDQLRKSYPLHTLKAQEYYSWCEDALDWFFDPESFNYAGLEDYQRLVLRNNGEYEDEKWESYRKLRNTLEGDQQYVKFWEKLTSATKWIEKPITTSSCAWGKLERMIYYQAVKIAADLPKMYSTLVDSGFSEYKWRIHYEYTFFRDYAWLYYEIWKRIAQQKMDLKEALDQLSAEELPITCSAEIEAELGYGRNPSIPGPITLNYEAFLADISGELEEREAHSLVVGAVEKFAEKWEMYYDYALKKLKIAEKIGLTSHETKQNIGISCSPVPRRMVSKKTEFRIFCHVSTTHGFPISGIMALSRLAAACCNISDSM